jgi:DNA invertase Pin-like site-specific DNA recombinase
MTSADLIPAAVLKRKAVVYVRQSTQSQVMTNLEGQRRQYDLVEVARQWGFADVEVIDDDLGRSASGMVSRPGFERLVAWLCAGKVGAVLCFDASRLARNGRDWHHLLELCGLVEARVIDLDGVYNPCRPNDRLLLGMKGSISEFELGVLRARMLDAARSKARRGELRLSRSLRLYLAPRNRARFGSRPASTGGDPAHLHPFPRTWQRPPSVALDEGGSYPLPEAVRRRTDDEL